MPAVRYIVAIRPPTRPIDPRKMMASCYFSVFFQGHLRFKLQVTDNDGVKFEPIDRMTILWNITAARDVDHSTWSDAQEIYGIRQLRGIQPTM